MEKQASPFVLSIRLATGKSNRMFRDCQIPIIRRKTRFPSYSFAYLVYTGFVDMVELIIPAKAHPAHLEHSP